MPTEELRSPKAVFGLAGSEPWISPLGVKLSLILEDVMLRTNCYSKSVHVSARLLKCMYSMDRSRILEPLNVQDIEAARRAQFVLSMGPTLVAMEEGSLEPLRPVLDHGIVFMQSRCDPSLPELFGVSRLPISARHVRLAKLIMIEAHYEGLHPQMFLLALARGHG